MSPQFLLTILALAPFVAAHINNQQPGSQPQDMRIYCGRALSRMIYSLCYENTSESDLDKRSGAYASPLMTPFYKEDNHLWPWTSKTAALGSFRGKRFIGGIADECCDKPCSVNELLSYCP